jgi:hypothetical protein
MQPDHEAVYRKGSYFGSQVPVFINFSWFGNHPQSSNG